MQVVERSPDLIQFTVDSRVFGESIVFKALYWHAADYAIDVTGSADGTQLVVAIRPRAGRFDDAQLTSLEVQLGTDLIDFKTREIVDSETRALRDLIVAKAFSPLDELDQPPPGTYLDSVEPKAHGPRN